MNAFTAANNCIDECLQREKSRIYQGGTKLKSKAHISKKVINRLPKKIKKNKKKMDGYVSTCSQKIQKMLLKKDKEIPSIWSETLKT